MADNTRDQLIDMKRQLTPIDLIEAEIKSAFTKRPLEIKKFKGRLARLKGMQTQWEPFKVQIDNYTAKKEAESKNLPEKIARLSKVIEDECAHPVEFLEVTAQYHEGDLAAKYTDFFVECALCKKREYVKRIEHNKYG